MNYQEKNFLILCGLRWPFGVTWSQRGLSSRQKCAFMPSRDQHAIQLAHQLIMRPSKSQEVPNHANMGLRCPLKKPHRTAIGPEQHQRVPHGTKGPPHIVKGHLSTRCAPSGRSLRRIKLRAVVVPLVFATQATSWLDCDVTWISSFGTTTSLQLCI